MPHITTKTELIRNLECTKHSHYISVFGIEVFRQDIEAGRTFPPIVSVTEEFADWPHYSIQDYIHFYDGRPNRAEDLVMNFCDAQKSATRTYLRETFEWLKDYCNYQIPGKGSQWSKMSSEPWYRVARIMRNSLSHNWILEFGGGELSDR